MKVLEVKRVQVGAIVRVQSESRMAVTTLIKDQPYMAGTLEAVLDAVAADSELVSTQTEHLQQVMRVSLWTTRARVEPQTAADCVQWAQL